MHGGSDGPRQGQDGLNRAPTYALARGPAQTGGGRGGAGIAGAAGGHKSGAVPNPQAGSLTQPPPSSSSLGRPTTQHSQAPSPHHWGGGPGHGRYLETDQDMRASADVWGSTGSGARGAGASHSSIGYIKPPSRSGGARPLPLASPRSHKDSQQGYSQGRSYVCPSPVEGGTLSSHPGYLRSGTAAGVARSGGGGQPPPGGSMQPTMTWPGQQHGVSQIPVVSDGDVAAFFRAAESSHMLPQDSSSDPIMIGLLGGGSNRVGASSRAATLGGPAWTMGASVYEHDGRPGTRGGGTMYDLEGRPLTRNGRPPSRMQVSTMRSSSHDTGGGAAAALGSTGGTTYASVTVSGLLSQQQPQHYQAPQHQQPGMYHSPSGRRTAPAPAPGQCLRGGQALPGPKDVTAAGPLARMNNGPRMLQPLQHRGLTAAGGGLTHAPPPNPLQSRSLQSKAPPGQAAGLLPQKAAPRSSVAVGVTTVAEEADVDAMLEGVGDGDLGDSGSMDDLNNYLAAIDQDKRASAQKPSAAAEVSSPPKHQGPAPEEPSGPSLKALKAATKVVDLLIEQAVRCSEVNALIRAAEEKALAEETELQVVLAEHGWQERVRATVASPVGDDFGALRSHVLPTTGKSGQAPLSADSDDVLAALPSPADDFKGLSSGRAQVSGNKAFGAPPVAGLVGPNAKLATVSPITMPLGMARYSAHRVQS